MRWEELFTELDAELEATERAELAAEVAERTRSEHSRIGLSDRLRAMVGSSVRLDVRGAGAVGGRLGGVGPDWALVEGEGGWDLLVCSGHVVEVSGLSRAAQAPEDAVAARFGLAAFLRGVARERRLVQVVREDGGTARGTIDRVGADHLDVTDHATGEYRLSGGGTTTRTVALAAVALVRLSP